MMIEVLFYDRIGKYQRGQVAEVEDGVFLRAALRAGKADVVNPPDWSPEKADAEAQEKFKVKDINKPRTKKIIVAETN